MGAEPHVPPRDAPFRSETETSVDHQGPLIVLPLKKILKKIAHTRRFLLLSALAEMFTRPRTIIFVLACLTAVESTQIKPISQYLVNNAIETAALHCAWALALFFCSFSSAFFDPLRFFRRSRHADQDFHSQGLPMATHHLHL